MRKIVPIVLSLIMATALLLQALPASATIKAGRSAELLVTGTVTDSGHTMTGIAVKVYAWPDQAVTSHLKPGQAVSLVLVGTATSAADGSYSVRVPEAALVREATNGVVNMEADGGSASYSFPWTLPAKAVGPSAVSTAAAVIANLSSAVPEVCGNPVKVSSLGPQWARVGQTYVPTTGANQTFSYSRGQSSSLGVGYSGSNGMAGSFHADGTASWSATSGVIYPTYGGRKDVWYRTRFIYGKYRRVCKPCPTCGTTVSWTVRVDGYAGGAAVQTRGITTPRANYCSPYLAGSTFYEDYSSAVTWSEGVYVAPELLDLSAHTGYSTSGHVQYHFTKNRNLCGTNNYPGEGAQDVVKP